MDAEARTRLLLLIDALDNAAAARIDTLDPAVALAVGVIVGGARKDPEWMHDQLTRGRAVIDALTAWVDAGAVVGADGIPEIVHDAIVAASNG